MYLLDEVKFIKKITIQNVRFNQSLGIKRIKFQIHDGLNHLNLVCPNNPNNPLV